MGPYWLRALGCLCLVLSTAFSASVSTPDTMVVAKSDEGDSSTTPAPATTEATTLAPAPPIKLTEMEVTSNIALRYAHTAVVTTVRNPAGRAQEATFRVLLPDTAFISSFTMILNGTAYKAYVKEKEEAKKIYNEAVSQGLGAAHVETKARDSNQFTVTVNVEPNTVAVFNLTYEELLMRRIGVYNHAISLHQGALVPKLTVTVRIRESEKITTLRVPEVRTGNEVDATPEDEQNSKAVIERSSNGKEATITFKPDLVEQQRLLEIYLEKTKESRPSPYGYDDGDQESKRNEVALGQFVVQYDVERPQNGEILVNDGYFVHFFAPENLPPLNKHCVFVLDTSGSMMDRKIVQLREAMQTILSELNRGDYFSIVEFASSVMVHELDEADQEPPASYGPYSYGPYSYSEYNKPPRLVPPSEATPENIAKAKVIVGRMQAAGGTNIYGALDVATDLIKKGIGWTPEPKTTPAPKDTTTPPQVPTPALPDPVVVVEGPKFDSDNNTQEVPKLEPIIIFLTDGDPTVGVTDPNRIINHITEKNAGPDKATIFSLGFGEDADRKFLRKLSLRNDGFMRHIYEAADAALQLRDFYRQVSSPLLADVHFVYPKKQVKADSLTKHQFRRYYEGSETVVVGRVQPDATELSPTVGAFCGVADVEGGRKYIEIVAKAPIPAAKEHFLPLERLWAYLTIKQLLDERDARDAPADDDAKPADSPDKRALDIALKYSFVTPLTSLVVVKPNATDAVNAESVDKQNQDLGFGFGGAAPVANSFAARPGMPGLPGPPMPSKTMAVYSRPVAIPSSAAQFASFSSPMQASAMALDAVDFEDEEALVYDPIAYSTTPRANPLAPYHLEEYGWLNSLLASGDAIEVPTNSTAGPTRLKLSQSVDAPRASSDEECASAAEGSGAGVCVYLSRCAVARDLSAQTYPAFHCSVGSEGYAGVCCPRDKVDVQKQN